MKGEKKLFTKDNLLSKPVLQGFICGLLEVAYILLIGIFIAGTESLFAGPKSWMIILGIVAFLILVVLSVAVTAVLVFYWPLYYFFERKFEEARLSFLGVVSSLFLIFMLIFLLTTLASLF
jgi:hypothetical protein